LSVSLRFRAPLQPSWHRTDHPRRRAAVRPEAQMKVEERAFTIQEAQDADEAFITSA
jgi:hypothetical protein